jgi:hypothetical protein
MYYSKIYSPGSGLTNQIFALITSIIIAIYKKESIIVIDSFLDDFSKENNTIISNILDMEQTNILLFKQYGVFLLDRHNIDNRLVPENIVAEINKNAEYNYTFGWINDINKDIFENILLSIRFHKEFVDRANYFTQNIVNSVDKTNVIHLRLEDDAITHWSRMNKVSEQDFKQYIENKYIDLIQRYFDKCDKIIIVSSSTSNGVIDFLAKNNYSYVFTDKHFDGREKNAITDLLISACCNNIFIGNFNPLKLNGSSFSYFISKILPANSTKIMIDLDRIYDCEMIQNL